MVEPARPRAAERQGRHDDARDAAEDRVGGCVRNGPVFSESHAAGTVCRRVRHDPRKFIGLGRLSGAEASGGNRQREPNGRSPVSVELSTRSPTVTVCTSRYPGGHDFLSIRLPPQWTVRNTGDRPIGKTLLAPIAPRLGWRSIETSLVFPPRAMPRTAGVKGRTRAAILTTWRHP